MSAAGLASDLQLREDHAARRGSDRPWLHGGITQANQLCGLDLDRFKGARRRRADHRCLYQESAAVSGSRGVRRKPATFVNIRETGGWSKDAAAAGPKAAALIAAAQEDMPPISLVTLESGGVALIYGRDEVAIEAAQRLADRLDITVLLSKPGDVIPRRTNEFPVLKGTIHSARGHLGEFGRLTTILPSPSSRAKLVFGSSRDGATSTCDLILDLSGRRAAVAHELRPGYLRADPRTRPPWSARLRMQAAGRNLRQAALCRFRAVAHAAFALPYRMHAVSICARPAIAPGTPSRSMPMSAPAAFCASVCPTGAASYALPSADALMRRLRTLLQTYRKAGGSDAVVLFHDGEHGEDIIDALARFGEGLPANVLPLRVNEVTQIGPEISASVFAYGGNGVALLTRAKPRHDITALRRAVETSDRVVSALGFGTGIIQDHRNRRPGPVARHAGCRPSRCRNAEAGKFRPARRETRRDRDDLSRASSCGACTRGRRAAVAGRALRHSEAECRGLHAVSCLRHRLPDRRTVR
jgi:hypothetical protein